jgi:pilus assembly protein Flp/PilA
MLVQKLKQFARNDSGATAIEYGLIVALLAAGLIVSFTILGDGLKNLFGTTETGAGGALERAADSMKSSTN